MPYSVFGNEFSKLFSGNGNLTIKNIMSINGFTGTDFQKTNFNDRKIFGSFIKNDSDKAKITIHAKRGSYFLYRSGPVNRNQFIEIENKKFIMPITLDWTWIKLDGSALPEEFNFTLMDNGGSWGEWSAIALIK